MKIKYLIISIRRNIFTISILVFLICLFFFSTSTLLAARNGLVLWAKYIVPSLFPFFIAAELMSHTNLIYYLGKLLNPIVKPLFKLPGISSFPLIMGTICGYPVGAKIVVDLRNKQKLTKDEGSRLLAFANNSGPLFIVSTVGIGLFANPVIGVLLLSVHLLSSISVGIVLGLFSDSFTIYSAELYNNNHVTPLSFYSFGDILSKAIFNSINTLLVIGGYIVFFSVIISILLNSNIISFFELILIPLFKYLNIDISYVKAFLIGLLEITEGINRLSSIKAKNISINILFTSFVLGFGGISVLLQILSIVKKSDLSVKSFLLGKLMQAFFSMLYCYIALSCFTSLNYDLYSTLAFSPFPCIILILIILNLAKMHKKMT